MSGEMNLQKLLRSMEPIKGSDYAFCVLDAETCKNLPVQPLATFQEREGLTVVLPVADADRLKLAHTYVGTHITLNVHSDLNAVGFLAAIAGRLASNGISLNAFSPYYHD